MKPSRDHERLTHRILECAIRAGSRVEFLREVSEMLLDFSRCDALEVWTSDGPVAYRWKARRQPAPSFVLEPLEDREGLAGESPDVRALCLRVIEGAGGRGSPFVTTGGSLWTADSIAVIPFMIDPSNRGLVVMSSARKGFFNLESMQQHEGVVQMVALAITSRRARTALRERVKELTCLYGISRITGEPDLPLPAGLEGIVRLLPDAWQYPRHARARITLDGAAFVSPGFLESPRRQAAGIVVGGRARGSVEVVYVQETPELSLRPFLEEEEKLLGAVAREVAMLVLRKEQEEERAILENQLRHSDRLATIGQLAAGVAHELNEPLGAILGFTQLAMKTPGLPGSSAADLARIEKASLHAREVVRKLMFFSRQIPPRTSVVDLNAVVNDGLYFLESRCARAGIEVIRQLDAEPPLVEADVSQLHQVLVNLVVNAIQAMGEGGRLTIRTLRSGADAVLAVEDTGTGMSEEVRTKIFTPFFTTKDVGQGTGLGLAVAHGIIRSHGGSIGVESEPGRGSRFEVRLPAAHAGAGREAPDG